jgi:hypothetical protein
MQDLDFKTHFQYCGKPNSYMREKRSSVNCSSSEIASLRDYRDAIVANMKLVYQAGFEKLSELDDEIRSLKAKK